MPVHDLELGQTIQQHLLNLKLENPVDFTAVVHWSQANYRKKLRLNLRELLNTLGLHDNPHTANATAERLVKFYLDERFAGLNYANFPQIGLLENQFAYRNPLIAKDISFISTCEHHLVGIKGKALLAYRPAEHLVGLNKLNQVLNFFAARPQLQERLTAQVFHTLQKLLQTEDVAIVLNAQHDCMLTSGISDQNTHHSSYQLGGIFASDEVLRAQILSYLA